MSNNKLPDQETFVAALCSAHPEYVKAGAVSVYARLTASDEDVKAAVVSWIGGGDVPELSAEGHSVSSLARDYGMNALAALLTIQWLRRDPVTAKKALKAGIR